MEVVRFALLGLGAGAIYALVAQGVVLVYRGSGVLNFAAGASGMIVAFLFYDAIEGGMANEIAIPLFALVAIGIGLAQYWLVMRPLRGASPLARLVAALATMTLLQALGIWLWGTDARFVEGLLPADSVTPVDGATMGVDRFWLLGIAIVATIVLALVYRRTRFGLATTATAENPRSASAYGISTDLVASTNWAAGTLLGATACVLVAPITSLQVDALTLLVIPAFAAAMLGRFRSFWLTLAGSLFIGVLESELARYSDTAGIPRAVPLLVIVVVLVVRPPEITVRGRRTPRPPHLGSGAVRARLLVPAVALGVLALVGAPSAWADATATSLTVALVLLSLVVVAGFTGQLSLAQYTLSGMAAWGAARLIVNYDVPMEVAILAGIALAVLLGLAVGLPALRNRGVSLAIATLALALALQEMILNNSERTGGFNGTNVGRFRVFGLDLTGFAHPQRYAIACFAVFVIAALAVANLRRGRMGLRLVAVRTNERAAAALGIHVAGVKLYAFGLGAAIAGIAGILIGFRNPNITFGQFNVFQSIYDVSLAVTGGIGFVIGAFVGALGATGGVIMKVFAGGLSDTYLEGFAVMFAALAVLVVIREPDGLVHGFRRRWRRRSPPRAPAVSRPLPVATVPSVRPRTLVVHDLVIRFGGVTAVDGLTFSVDPGKVVGLIGPNGAGKTTTIDAVTGFVGTAAGDITLDGTSVRKWPTRRRARAGLGRTFQTLELFDSLTVRDNLRVAAEDMAWWRAIVDLLRPGKPALGAPAVAAVTAFGLEGDLDRAVEELPLGRRRLVALARALAAHPSVLLLDEPAAGLDRHERVEMGQLVRRVADEWGCGVLLVEHDVNLVFDVCDRVEVLDFGEQIASGLPEEVRSDQGVIDAYLGTADTQRPATGHEPSTASAALRARGLSAGYGDLVVARDLDLDVVPGEIVAIVGPNGAGKTTILLTLAGVLPAIAGTIEWDGRSGRRPLHTLVGAGVGVVLDDRTIITELSVKENLRLASVDAAAACVAFPELEALLTRRVGLLSGGEQQMLSLARVLAQRPRLVLADELSLGLAPQIVERLFHALRAAADDGAGVLLVEQQAHTVLRYSDRVVVLNQGRVQLEERTSELRDEDVLRAYFSELEPALLPAHQDPTEEERPHEHTNA